MQSRVKGTGLGLPLSKRLAELLGGSIAVQSSPGQGSVFSVTVPRVHRAAEVVETAEEEWAVDPTRVPVLVVDDDLADSFAIQRLLSGTRYQPIVARTVAAARRALERIQPAAVLLDVVLAGDESWRLILGPRQEETTVNIPIVVTSSTGEERKNGTEGLAQLLTAPADVVLLDLKMPEMTGFELLNRISDEKSLDGIPAIVLTSAICTLGERQRLRRAARVMSKSDLSGSALAGAITDALGGSPSEAV